MVRRILIGVLAVAVAAILVRTLLHHVASEETKIRRRIVAMVEGFNERRLRDVMDGLAPGFRDAASGGGRSEVQAALMQLFLTEFDPKRGEFLLSLELDPQSVEIVLGEDGTAEVTLRAELRSRRGGSERVVWPILAAGSLARSSAGWQWTQTTRVNHADRGRFR
jgi:hypothetical protein